MKRTNLRDMPEKRKIQYLVTATVVVLLAAAALLIRHHAEYRTYSSYSVEKAVERSDSVSKYEYAGNRILQYSTDGASLLTRDLTAVWNASYAMSDPRADVNGDAILIYDRGGTEIRLFDAKEETGSFETERPILMARVSRNDTAAVITTRGNDAELHYYEKDGSEIAEGRMSATDPGYPLAMSVSDDGTLLAVSYLAVSDGSTDTDVRFYQFGSYGRSRENNLVSEKTFPGEIAPMVQYLNGSECVVFRDGGFTVFRGAEEPAETKSVDFNSEITTVFHDGTHIGFVFRSTERGHKYRMLLYTTNGNLLTDTWIDQTYDDIRVCGNVVVFTNRSQFSVLSMNGVCRFSARMSGGTIRDVLKIGNRRLLIVTDSKMEVIHLS